MSAKHGVTFSSDSATGLVQAARQLQSPNCHERPPALLPDLIAVYGVSLPAEEFGGPWIDALLTNQLDARAHPSFTEIAPLKVSSHLLIRRNGEVVKCWGG
jgi:N-acetyl-anhydromuramoyl-L-alanine amidase